MPEMEILSACEVQVLSYKVQKGPKGGCVVR